MAVGASMFKTALAVLLVFETWTAECVSRRQSQKQNHWVDIWGSMPQLVEYSNMPPIPFVRNACSHPSGMDSGN